MTVSVHVATGFICSIDDVALCSTLPGDLERDWYELVRRDDLERKLLIMDMKRGLALMRGA